MTRSAFGSGPGAIAPDGSAVELYALLRGGREPEVVHAAIPEGASILELGAGAGRITSPLVELGHAVVAVDESRAMLERISGAHTVLSRIEELRLPERFDAVLLASHLVNEPDRELVRAFLRTCRRHVRGGGCVLIERHAPAWFDHAAPSTTTRDGMTFVVRDVARPGPGLLKATVEYRSGNRVWAHAFVARRLDDEELHDLLGEAGLRLDAVLTADGAWLRALPD